MSGPAPQGDALHHQQQQHISPESSPPVVTTRVHPLSPLSAAEFASTAALIRQQWPADTELHFKCISLLEPPKTDVIQYLDAEHARAQDSTNDAQPALPTLVRKAWVNYYLRNTNRFHEAVVNLSEGTVERNVRLGANVHGNGDGEEIIAIELAALEDPGVKQEIEKLRLPEGAVVICDPWIYGADGVNDDERMYQCFLYMRDPQNPSEADSNHYALPLRISPVVSAHKRKVIRIELLPTGADSTVKPLEPYQIRPPNEYIPEHQTLRTDLKPLHVVQPEGASFTVETEALGSVVEWQKWRIRVGFNQREGPVLYDIRYDSRPIFYRVSLSDMNIPYADPRAPFHKKSAFDLGDAGAGLMANNLKLGCDCLGSIHYLDGLISDEKGGVTIMPNVICLHEQDAGIGWKHTNYRTGRAAVVRQRELVLQTIITVSNYEYILAYIFNQAGEFTYEVRATGILSTQPVDDGVNVPFGTVVHPGVLAVHHQHLFSLRVDPCIDGHSNRLVYEEAHAMPRSKDFNPHGTGYAVHETVVQTSGGYDLAWDANRVFKIQNAQAPPNPINGKPVGYKIMAPPFQKILSDPESFNHRRAEFGDHNIYVTSYRDGELFAGGQYTNQSRGGTGVRSWASRNDSVVDTDIVVFVQFGINHIPRVEDFPVMPCETLRVMFKPVNFFTKNPAIDVPPSEQGVNKSTLLSEQVKHMQPSVEVQVGQGGQVLDSPQTTADGPCCDVGGGKSKL